MKFDIFRRIFSNSNKIEFEMDNYPGMTLNNEVRESVSVEEDDLSDVEDEVFIRDGKNSYKTAEEIYVKRPLMAPRRKTARPNLARKMRNKPPCRAFCRPCCYFLGALSVLIGLIVLVIILVSIFPLPLDRIHNWIVSKFTATDPNGPFVKLLPCSDYKISDVWTVNLPKLTTDSPIYLLDVDSDGVNDVLFGFGTGDNYDIIPPDIFCSIFMGVSPPCEGGIIALNGVTGEILWRYWTNDTIYSIHCSEDVNKDGLNDCLLFGTKGTISLIDTRNGTALWKINHNTEEDIITGSFIEDQNNDTIADILAVHTNMLENEGNMILLSGKNGDTISKIPIGGKSFYMPQILHNSPGKDFIILGNGGPSTSGNLSAIVLDPHLFSSASNKNFTLYQDPNNGVFIQSVLVDLNGDNVPDIVSAMYNSTVVAIDGRNFSQIWNFTVPNASTNTVPTPCFFNFDNVTDFLVIYETYDVILKYNYTQTFILSGATGKPIYQKPISDSIGTQIGGISLSMESYGYDIFLFWTSECRSIDIYKKLDVPVKGINVHPLFENCHHQENTTVVLKLNMLNQFDQPPGVEIYNSMNRSILEFNSTKSPMQIIKEYFNNHPKLSPRMRGQEEIGEGYDNNNAGKIGIHKYGNSNFRHKDNRKGLLKDFSTGDSFGNYQDMQDHPKPYNPYYEPGLNTPDEIEDYSTGEEVNKERNLVMKNPKRISNRDPRSKPSPKKEDEEMKTPNTDKTSEGVKTGSIYDYKNVRLARSRLLHDLSNSPDEILSDIFYKNLENRLRTSKFEQRDLSAHRNKKAEEESISSFIEEHKKMQKNATLNLWNLESEKEETERRNNYWRSSRRKRDIGKMVYGSLRKVTSVAAITESLQKTNGTNSIDVIFLTYWQPTKYEPRKNLEEELAECVEEKLATEGQRHHNHKTTEEEKRNLFFNECVLEQSNFKGDFPYFNDIYKLNLGQMTVYRLRIECQCNLVKRNEKCAKFLPESDQSWPSYLGRRGDGTFFVRNRSNPK
ncbi:uncharacterized protein LOC123308894 [Coccinella septempunctata]|uniref:uncharacterized protein LOC123308894 n=1 Tax=Coccinella septempunctata TaxID=41139 RepID=UPI001D08506E|nr:uncharacterized protein LOC123308894 [Coccinella septempunctata]